MVRINLSDGLFDPFVERKQSGMQLVRWLIERVVAGHPGVILVMLALSAGDLSYAAAWRTYLCEMLPDDHCSVLEILVLPN
jgi:hypothetical protein